MRLAVIGLGERTTGLLGKLLAKYPDVRIAAIADPAEDLVAQRLARIGLAAADVRRLESVEQLINQADQFDAGMIGTRCSRHSPLAVQWAKTGLPLFLEKPIAISREQLTSLQQVYRGREHTVVVSFPLRVSPLMRKALEYVRSGRIGKLNQVQAINNVPYGGIYFGQWYRDYAETGGLWLQKATHDFDYINQFVNAQPERVAAVGSRTIYGGDMPDDLKCSQCDRTAECPESPENIVRRGDAGGMGNGDHWCAFSRSIGHHDSGSALVMYDNGVHVSYSQNFITRRSAARRGAIITGYTATVEFDWYQSAGRVIDHHTDKVERFEVQVAEGHAGGDDELLKNFVGVVAGRERSRSDLSAGIVSVAICLAARESERTQTFQPIERLASVRADAPAEELAR